MNNIKDLNDKKTLLITGGLGFIGSHTCVQLLESGFKIIIIDNLVNSKGNVIKKIKELTKKDEIEVFIFDLLDAHHLESIFQKYSIYAVIHFAGLKAVKESLKYPLEYYSNNLISTLNLLNIMKKYHCKRLIFSSSATVYGDVSKAPFYEDSPIGNGISNPYGGSKYMIEKILKDLSKAEDDWSLVVLRYFNPIGCHPSGMLGENPNNTPNNLFPYLLRVIVEDKPPFVIFGNDYPTKDGTAIRDFIHVVDLARAHILSIKKLETKGLHIYNVGTGEGKSVLDVINTFNRVNNISLYYVFGSRREGDLDIVFANCDKIRDELGWKPELTLEDMCRDGYNYLLKGGLV